jgi:hypothetical protein
MAVVHEYVPSSDKSGFYLRDGFGGNIVTYQVSAPAEELLYHLDYDDSETLQQEIFDILHRLGLIYTHNSGVEPPDSLMDIELDEDQVRALDTDDRETIITHLLNQSQLDQNQRSELRAYAETRNIHISEPEVDGEDSGSDSKSSESADGSAESYSVEGEDSTGGRGAFTQIPRVKCEYCEQPVKAVDYISHVRSLSGPHDEPGTIPDNFIPGAAALASVGDVDILYQEDLSEDYSYYPVCRWCGTRFLRLPSYRVHLNSGRESLDEALHSRDPDRYRRPILLPFEDSRVFAVASRIEAVVTPEAADKLDSVIDLQPHTPCPGGHGPHADDAEPDEPSESGADEDGESDSLEFDSRIDVYEQSWVLTDLARFLDLLTRSSDENTQTHAELSRHHAAILDQHGQLSEALDSQEGTLRNYRQAWEKPEIGIRVPEDLLAEYGLDDYRGELHVPPGYPIPIRNVYETLTREWVSDEYAAVSGQDELSVFGESDGETTDEEEDIPTEGIINRDTATDYDQHALNSDSYGEPQIPLSTLIEVLQEFETYEADRREPSWFHASTILRDAVESELDNSIEELSDIEEVSR